MMSTFVSPRFIYVWLCSLLPLGLSAQDTWSLTRCIEYAQTQSLQIKQNKLSITQSELSQRQAEWQRYPTLNASVRHSFNFGRSVDLTRYEFVNQSVQATSLGINLNVPIYQGGRVVHQIKKSQIDVAAALQDYKQTEQDVSLNVAQAYLSVLLAQESLRVVEEQRKTNQAQLNQTLKLIQAGSLPDNARYELQAQLARDEQGIINAENSITLALVNLKVLMNYPVEETLNIETPVVNLPEQALQTDLGTIYEEAVQNRPNIQAAKLREKSAEINVRVAESAYYPSVSAFGSLNTNYSSRGQRFTGDSINTTQSFRAIVGGNPIQFDIPSSVPAQEKNPFFNQLNDNFNQSAGFSVQVPIFNAMQNRIAVQQAALAQKQSELATQQLKVELKNQIQKAITDARAAQKRWEAASKAVDATRIAVENTRKRFQIGVVNGFELTSAQNTLLGAESELIQSRYDFLFKLKVLDFYLGRPLNLQN